MRDRRDLLGPGVYGIDLLECQDSSELSALETNTTPEFFYSSPQSLDPDRDARHAPLTVLAASRANLGSRSQRDQRSLPSPSSASRRRNILSSSNRGVTSRKIAAIPVMRPSVSRSGTIVNSSEMR
jgi:hypothetical protein